MLPFGKQQESYSFIGVGVAIFKIEVLFASGHDSSISHRSTVNFGP
jgi:hypothetical protein